MKTFYVVLLNHMLAPLCLPLLDSVKAEKHWNVFAWFIKLWWGWCNHCPAGKSL